MLFGRKKRSIQRVLVVEDEPLVAFDTEHFLHSEGFEIVATVDSVAEALRVMDEDDAIDLVLADVNLSDGSGVTVAEAAQERAVRVLFVTADCPKEARALAVGCLAKPYPQKDLLAAIEAIETVIEGRQPRKLPVSFSLFGAPA
ncbi:response regulator [Sphingomonas sp.]|uniref:response regulator n=1 Tax=Sphingomonas sp. TaxID=28214 RepID=UPI0025D1D2CB|nr:response regulator [Sphingomonas sp.]